VDVAIVATSSLKALEDAIDMVRKGGTVMMFGVPSKDSKLDLDMNKIYSKEITLVTSYAASDQDTKDSLDLIESSQINVKQLITHTYPIIDSQKAFDHARSGDNAMKIIITK
jgi:L-iditol 2-dehydrogenase